MKKFKNFREWILVLLIIGILLYVAQCFFMLVSITKIGNHYFFDFVHFSSLPIFVWILMIIQLMVLVLFWIGIKKNMKWVFFVLLLSNLRTIFISPNQLFDDSGNIFFGISIMLSVLVSILLIIFTVLALIYFPKKEKSEELLSDRNRINPKQS